MPVNFFLSFLYSSLQSIIKSDNSHHWFDPRLLPVQVNCKNWTRTRTEKWLPSNLETSEGECTSKASCIAENSHNNLWQVIHFICSCITRDCGISSLNPYLLFSLNVQKYYYIRVSEGSILGTPHAHWKQWERANIT